MTNRISISVLALSAALGSGCGGGGGDEPDGAPDQPDAAVPDAPPAPRCTPDPMRTDLAWYGDNRETVEAWLDQAGCASDGYDDANRPIAMFDWDNTVLKNDVGDAITFWMIKHDKVLQPPGQDWHATSAFMTDAAAAALTVACGTTVAAGQPLPTSTDLDCADEMLSMYIDGRTTVGAGAVAAFAGWNYRRIEPTYAWTAQLLAGYTHAEIQDFTIQAITPMLAAAEDTTQVVGTRTLNGWLRIYDQIADLVHATQERGFDTWVITASPQDVVAAFAPMVGLDAAHVVGIRSMLDANSKLTYRFEGCGPVPDGEASMISYIEGKRCWINKVIYGDDSLTAIRSRPDGMRPYFAAGDSDTDISFLRDADYKLVLNRNKKEIMCHAYDNDSDSWRINPMFIQPKAMQSAPYPCSTSACKDAAGVAGPCLDDHGSVIPDQVDSVHAP